MTAGVEDGVVVVECDVGQVERLLERVDGVELGPHGVRVVNVAPGAIETPINADDDHAEKAALRAAIPLRRLGTTEQMGKVTCFVASDAGRG